MILEFLGDLKFIIIIDGVLLPLKGAPLRELADCSCIYVLAAQVPIQTSLDFYYILLCAWVVLPQLALQKLLSRRGSNY